MSPASRGSTCRCSTSTACRCTRAGITRAEPGLSFVGLHFLYAMSSSMIHGVGRDAEYVAERILERSDVTAKVSDEPVEAVA